MLDLSSFSRDGMDILIIANSLFGISLCIIFYLLLRIQMQLMKLEEKMTSYQVIMIKSLNDMCELMNSSNNYLHIISQKQNINSSPKKYNPKKFV